MPRYSRQRAVCLTNRVDEAPQVLSFDEDRCRGWSRGGDWDWLCDCGRQQGGGDEGDCSEASEHGCEEEDEILVVVGCCGGEDLRIWDLGAHQVFSWDDVKE